MSDLVYKVLWGGLGTSVLFSLIVLWSWYKVPHIWIADVTEGEEKPPMTKAGWWVLISILVVMLSGFTLTLVWINQATPLTFWQGMVVSAAVAFVLNAVDVFIIDILIYMWIRPRWMHLEGYPPLYSYWAHVKASLKGMVTSIPLYAAAAGLMFLF